MYYPSSTNYTTQSMKKFRRSDQKGESAALIQDYSTQRISNYNAELQKELEQARVDQITCERNRRQAEEHLYQIKLKYDDAQKETQFMREKIIKLEGEKQVVQAEGSGEIRALKTQIDQLEHERNQLRDENTHLKTKNDQLQVDIKEMISQQSWVRTQVQQRYQDVHDLHPNYY